MSNQRNQIDPVEALWREFHEADRAGVFARTPVSIDAARSSTAPTEAIAPALPAWVLQVRRRWVPIAALLAVVVSVWGFLLSRELNHIQDGRSPSVATLAQAGDDIGHRFALRCLNGPGGSIDEGCRSFDLDTDGQITLADYGAHQLAPTRRRDQ